MLCLNPPAVTFTVSAASLNGPALDLAVALALGAHVELRPRFAGSGESFFDADYLSSPVCRWREDWRPSDTWAFGGPLIENCGIGLAEMDRFWEASIFSAGLPQSPFRAHGNTALKAAMRALVVALAGEFVTLPLIVVAASRLHPSADVDAERPVFRPLSP